jgi:penicillin-binding protein 2
MPSEEWKIKNYKQKWYAGETISVGIGQGAVATTPIQLARAIGAITTDGSLRRPHVAFPDQFPTGFKQVANYNDETKIPIDEENWTTITNAMAQVVSPMGTAGRAAVPGIDIAGKTGSAQTVSNDLKKKMSATEKSLFKDNGWFVGVTPRRNPEIVVACLFEGGEHGALAAAVATKVIKAYVEKQRNRQTQVAKAAAGNKAEVAAVWHDGDAKPGDDKLQGGHFSVPVGAPAKSATAAPGINQGEAPLPASTLEATESHREMANPEPETPPQALPTQPALRQSTPDPQVPVQPNPNPKKPADKLSIAPAAAIVRSNEQ